jgi:hypothetical protein
MAWLNATPKPAEGSDAAKREKVSKRVSRIERLRRNKVSPPMPPNPAPHIINRLVEIGLTEAAGMGVSPLSWGEINEWCCRTKIDLPPWEARLIRKLSTEYIAESRRAEDETCQPPWRAKLTRREVEVDEAGLRSLLG